MLPKHPAKVVYFRDNIHRPGYGATESWALPENAVVDSALGVFIPCDGGQSTFVPWSNIKNIMWDAPKNDSVVPLKKNVKPKT